MRPADRVTGRDIILDIVENMRAYQEELLYSSVVPTSFDVHLHPDDYDRLEGIFPTIAAEAKRALDEELARQNRRVGPEWLRRLTTQTARAQRAHESWAITFYRDENDELKRGEVLVDSRLKLPEQPEIGSGTRTRRITTSRIGQHTTSKSEVITETTAPPIPETDIGNMPAPPPLPVASPPSAAPPASATAESVTPGEPAAPAPSTQATTPPVSAASESADATRRTSAPVVFATLTYEDQAGRHTHPVTESQLVIGRGGPGYWVDLKIDAAQDISREHIRLRRDAATGQFYLKDVSLYGTTVNGQRVATSIDSSNGARRDLNVEVPLPPVARIGLADMVFLEFRQADAS